jgi:predicted dehydrogenase
VDPEHYFNWRLYSQPDGGPCLHALPASIDTANWFCATLPSRVYTSGGTNYWRDGRDTPDNLSAVFDYVIKKGSAGFTPIDCRSEFQDLFQLMKTYTVRCNYSYSLTSTRLGVYDHIMGDQAALALSPSEPCRFTREPWTGIWTEPRLNYTQEEQEAITKRYKALIADMSSEEVLKIRFTRGSSFNGPPEFAPHRRPLEGDFAALGSEESAEVHQFRAFAEHIRNGGTPRANVMVGLAAVIAGESARRSYETRQPVDIDPALMEFDFETPSISLYDTNAAPIPGTTELM